MSDKFIQEVDVDYTYDPEDLSTLNHQELEKLLLKWKQSLKILRS